MELRALYTATGLPVLQNKTFGSREEALACPTGDVILAQNPETGLVSNIAFDPTIVVYDQNYQNEQACSPRFQSHLDEVEGIISRHLKGKILVDVGCGKGGFLRQLRSRGFTITGIDPAYEGNDPGIIKACFDRSVGFSADGVVLRHVLEQIPDPLAFLEEIRVANNNGGLIYIEVPCFDWICNNRAWFDIYYEHVNYFRLDDLLGMFGEVREFGRLFGGQYLYILASLQSLKRPACERMARIPENLTDSLEMVSASWNKTQRHVIWGAASKGVIFSLHLQRRNLFLEFAVDLNPAKQARYLPVTGLKVLSLVEAESILSNGDCIFVANSNYIEEIRSFSKKSLEYVALDDGIAKSEVTGLSRLHQLKRRLIN
jgi:hypothetical protein